MCGVGCVCVCMWHVDVWHMDVGVGVRCVVYVDVVVWHVVYMYVVFVLYGVYGIVGRSVCAVYMHVVCVVNALCVFVCGIWDMCCGVCLCMCVFLHTILNLYQQVDDGILLKVKEFIFILLQLPID